MLTTCGACVALTAQKKLQKVLEAKSKAEAAADVLLKLFQQKLASSGNVFTVPNVTTIDRSIKNAKAKGACPEARLPVAISSRLKKDSLKTGYSMAHIRHKTATSQSNVMNLIIESLLVVIHDHLDVQGFSFVAGDFFLVDSGWSPILDGDPDKPTELFYKGLATSSKKKGIAGIKFVQPTQENWFMVIKPAVADKYDIWAAGGEITLMSMPVNRAIRKKKGHPIPMQSIGASEVTSYIKAIMQCHQFHQGYSQSSSKSKLLSKRSSKKLSPPDVEERQKRICPDIMPSICERWFDAILDLIEKGGTYIEGQPQLGELEHWVEICNIPHLGHIYIDWAESPEKHLGSGSFKTVHLGVLQVGVMFQGIPLPPALQGNICIKCPYQGVTRSGDPRRSPEGYERTCVLQEANTLHDMSLDMVLSKAASLGTAPGPIPDLCFVKATVVMKSRPNSVRLKDWLGFCALVERLLSTDDFVKYVCNGTPQPIDLASNEKHHNVVFLCFLQHVQYHFTKAKAFVSDYQDENIEGSIECFGEQHLCNAWCKWFELPEL
ncbi:hypothetical protein ARMGADRAFT_1031876 [Armillaria gallica]|uniref:Alpha-type protein kinase domain-containing protein n=1 Tax=Armillaria gallica TaxID=47427 RepID=A0A2H3DSD6_ARMGA|nr:hypothetical protein ARMGADRAFT_1031876 [Armillaria gallica]